VAPLSASSQFPPKNTVDRNNVWFWICMALKNPEKSVS
jgi:hypothetical protein